MEIKPGDWVKCINTEKSSKYLTLYSSYIVVEDDPYDSFPNTDKYIYIVDNTGEVGVYYMERFILDLKRIRLNKIKQLLDKT